MSDTTRPLIIVTGPNKSLRFGWWATRLMLWMAGLKGVYLTSASKHLPEGAKGIIIGGGDDIEPEHYGLMNNSASRYDPDRDRMEMDMVRKALDAGVPIMGICRGAQLINVVLGGSLHADIRPRRRLTPNRNSLLPIKWVDISEDSLLKKLINKKKIKINSLHSQAVDRVAVDLNVVARDRDDFIQAVETTDQKHFILGVQWHPEYMPYAASQRRLFSGFSEAVCCSDKRLNGGEMEQVS